MYQQVCSVLIKCLLASIFFHGLQASSLAANRASLRARRSSEATIDLTLSVHDDTVLIIRNTTSNNCILFDIQKNVVLLLNGGQGSGIVIGQQENKATLIPGILWRVSEQTLTGFLKSIDNDISSLLHKQNCTDFSIPRVQKNILKQVYEIVQDLVVFLDPELEQHPELALELVLSVATAIEKSLGGVLEGILEIVGDEQIQLTIDIAGVQNLLQGIEIVNNYLHISAKEVTSKNKGAELTTLLCARNGLVSLSEALRVLGETCDLSPLNSPLGDPKTMANLVALFGGNSNIGITGVFRVVGEILALVNGETSLERVISILILVVAQSSEVVNVDLSSQLRNSLTNVLEIVEELNLTKPLKDFVQVVHDLYDGKLVVDGVDISDIISTMLAGFAGPKEDLVDVIITVLQSLSPIVDPSQSIPELLLVLIIQLDSASGIRNLIALGFDIGSSGCSCSLLQNALESISKLSDNLSEDLYATSCKLPIIGNLILSLEAVLEAKNLNLGQLLAESELIQNLIRGIYQLASGYDIGIAQDQLDQCGEMMKSCNGLSTLVAVQVTVTVIVVS